jgi:hypothetical protein
MAMSATPSRQPKAVAIKKGPAPVATQQMPAKGGKATRAKAGSAKY